MHLGALTEMKKKKKQTLEDAPLLELQSYMENSSHMYVFLNQMGGFIHWPKLHAAQQIEYMYITLV